MIEDLKKRAADSDCYKEMSELLKERNNELKEKLKNTNELTEYLLDVANYAMFRYMFPMPGEFFKATDSSESAGTVGTPVNMER